MNIGDILVLAVLFGLLSGAAVWYFIRRKNGKNGCGGDCDGCPYKSENCENKKTDRKNS